MLAILAAAALVALPAAAEEPTGTSCGLYALFDPDDAGQLVTYDGLRKGLELAQLPRVCRYDPARETGGIPGFLERQAAEAAALREAGQRVESLFAIGDNSVGAVLAEKTAQPFVMAVERYTAKRKPIAPLPDPARGAVVYADMPVEQVGELLRDMLKRTEVSAWIPRAPTSEGVGTMRLKTLGEAAGLEVTDAPLDEAQDAGGERPAPDAQEPEIVVADVVLHLRLGSGWKRARYQDAARAARQMHVPLVTDDRARFGHGAVVVIVARQDLLGKAAADEARKIREDPAYRPKPRAVPGMEVWVDLEAADRQGIDLPLPFIARADKLRRGAARGGR